MALEALFIGFVRASPSKLVASGGFKIGFVYGPTADLVVKIFK